MILTNDYNEIGIFHQRDFFEPTSEIVLIKSQWTRNDRGAGNNPPPFLCVKALFSNFVVFGGIKKD
jgi:hypothetical protein